MAEPQSEKADVVETYPPALDRPLTVGEDEFYIDRAKEIKLLAKLDLAFTPIIMLLYLSCFLDRSNIGMHSFTIWHLYYSCLDLWTFS